jgi:hypothetical protein
MPKMAQLLTSDQCTIRERAASIGPDKPRSVLVFSRQLTLPVSVVLFPKVYLRIQDNSQGQRLSLERFLNPAAFSVLIQNTAPWTGRSVSCECSIRDSVINLCMSPPRISLQYKRQLWTFDRWLNAEGVVTIYRATIYR